MSRVSYKVAGKTIDTGYTDTISLHLDSVINIKIINIMILIYKLLKEEKNQFDKYTIDEATTKIRDLVNDLKEHGIDVKTDEMNFEKSFQIIIKIDKTNT